MALDPIKIPMTGNDAGAYAMKQIDPDVCAAYPITPSTEFMQTFAQYVADGEVCTELVTVESEHSAMSACVGAAAGGARTMTATSANGLALMWEILYIAASLRLPIAMTIVNRALSGNINIHCDHSDMMGCRDAGWLQLYGENAQECYDLLMIAMKTAENHDVLLPSMVGIDGFIISHTMEIVNTLPDNAVKSFVGEYKPKYSLLTSVLEDKPITVGPLDFHDFYFEHKHGQLDAYEEARGVFKDTFKEFEELSGRKYDFIEKYRTDAADVILVTIGSNAGTAKEVVDTLREAGQKVGLVKITVFRPFPHLELLEALGQSKCVVVMDRVASFGAWGSPTFSELRSALYGQKDGPQVINFIYGLGGRDTGPDQIEQAFAKGLEVAKTGLAKKTVDYLGVRK